MKYYKLCFMLFLSLFIFAGCATNKHNVYESSKKQTYLPYSDLARISHLSLEHDGYIIGIEKRPREDIEGAPKDREKRKRFETISMSEDDHSMTKREKRNVHKRNEKFTDYISDGTIMFVSHVASYFEKNDNTKDYNKFRRPVFLYNAYDEYKDDKLDYEKGYKEALENFEKDLRDKLTSKTYTHIILFSMGWNNNQQESIYRYNKIVTNLNNIDKEDEFKPLIIGFTWPSVWFSIEDNWLKKNALFLASYFTKQDDADEIGMTIANWITHNIVLQVNKEVKEKLEDRDGNYTPPKVIAIGHSMGARILSRAIFSNEYIKPEFHNSTSQVNLFIGLQAAFSANRFVADDGWEGSPYAEFSERETVFSLTTSKNDKANPIAAFITGAKHTGGRHGLRIANKAKNKDVFEVVTWVKDDTKEEISRKLQSTQTSNNQGVKKRVIMIDAKEIVLDKKDDSSKDPEVYPGYDQYPDDAHNDILDDDMAALIWALIENFAK